MQKRKRRKGVASFFQVLYLELNSRFCLLCISYLYSLNYLNGVLIAAGILAALLLAALVAAAHCNECNSSDKKHFLHVFKKFFS
jgi:exosortase/archaeosortase